MNKKKVKKQISETVESEEATTSGKNKMNNRQRKNCNVSKKKRLETDEQCGVKQIEGKNNLKKCKRESTFSNDNELKEKLNETQKFEKKKLKIKKEFDLPIEQKTQEQSLNRVRNIK